MFQERRKNTAFSILNSVFYVVARCVPKLYAKSRLIPFLILVGADKL